MWTPWASPRRVLRKRTRSRALDGGHQFCLTIVDAVLVDTHAGRARVDWMLAFVLAWGVLLGLLVVMIWVV